jgi:four helix bundle protein
MIDLKLRTKQFSLRIINLYRSLPQNKVSDVIGHQLLRSGTSVGANYRAACRAKSQADFINKIHIAEEEADESMFWMELLIEGQIIKEHLLKDLMNEAKEILAILSASAITAKKNRLKSKDL